ncbi:MAG: dCTP deaminase [Thermoplasmatota archaeon]
MILSDADIVRARKHGDLSIEPFEEGQLTPNGYDLSIREIMVDGTTAHEAVVPSMTWFAVASREYLKLPRHAAQLWIRSSYARRGVLASFGKVDVGFEGTLTLSFYNTGGELELRRGDTVCQIVFEEMASAPRKRYAGKYKGQQSITLG